PGGRVLWNVFSRDRTIDMEAVESGQSVTPKVAPTKPAEPPANAAPENSALATVPLFGGLRGRRTRKDGLKPGSPEAVAADRERDRRRKQKLREKLTEPDPLPSQSAAVDGPVAAPVAGEMPQP